MALDQDHHYQAPDTHQQDALVRRYPQGQRSHWNDDCLQGLADHDERPGVKHKGYGVSKTQGKSSRGEIYGKVLKYLPFS